MNNLGINPEKRMAITKSMSKEAICILMSECDLNVYKLMKMAAQVDFNLILIADTMNLRGVQLRHIYLDFCEGWFETFKAKILGRDQEMIDWINRRIPHMKAVKNFAQHCRVHSR